LFPACAAFATLAHALDTYRVGSHLVSIGDSVSALVDALGEPLYKEPVESRYGNSIADRWQYRLNGKAVQFTIRGGRIEYIEEIRDEQ
jgi:hypothetical protein